MIRRILDHMTTVAIGLVLAGAVWNVGAALYDRGRTLGRAEGRTAGQEAGFVAGWAAREGAPVAWSPTEDSTIRGLDYHDGRWWITTTGR